jgi:cell division protein FtsB
MLGYRTVRYRRHDVSVYLHSLAENALEAEVSKLKQRVCEVEAENAQLRENHGGEISEN